MQTANFAAGLPDGWAFLKDGGNVEAVNDPAGNPAVRVNGIAYLADSAPDSGKDAGYTAEVTFTHSGDVNQHYRFGLAFCLSPDGEAEDYLRIAIDGLGHHASVYSRYVAGSRGELWGPRRFPLLMDEGEAEGDLALDAGEYWTLRATVRPGSSPGAIDLLVSVFDQDGKPRLDPAGRSNVANGICLLRELAIKDALRRGPLGLMAGSGLVKQVRWVKH
jgi:hypothetical protein